MFNTCKLPNYTEYFGSLIQSTSPTYFASFKNKNKIFFFNLKTISFCLFLHLQSVYVNNITDKHDNYKQLKPTGKMSKKIIK